MRLIDTFLTNLFFNVYRQSFQNSPSYIHFEDVSFMVFHLKNQLEFVRLKIIRHFIKIKQLFSAPNTN